MRTSTRYGPPMGTPRIAPDHCGCFPIFAIGAQSRFDSVRSPAVTRASISLPSSFLLTTTVPASLNSAVWSAPLWKTW